MNARRTAIGLVAGLTLLGSAIYVFIYLYRWEWNRALISAVLFLGAEVGVTAWLITSRLRSVADRLANLDRRHSIASHLRGARSEPSHVFAWLRPDGSKTNVFVPILMGAGLAMSGLAWVVERLGRATAGATVDASIAAQLARLGPPPGGFLDDGTDPLSILRAPTGASR